MRTIYLRELKDEDVNLDYLNGFKDDSVLEFLEVNGKNLSKQDVIDYKNHGLNTGTYFMYAICLIDNDKHIGNLKIGPITKKHGLSDLVTVIWDSNYWGKGLATESIKLGNHLAFTKHNIRKLTGGIAGQNIGSIKAYTKAGWIIEGKLLNHYLIDGKLQDRVVVSCFNPCYFNDK